MKLKLLEILKTVGSGILRNAVPYGGVVLSAVNALLPDDKQMSDDATGSDIQQVVDSLPTDQRAKIIDKKFDIDETFIKESASCVRATIEADAKMPHTTRPKIALGCFRILCLSSTVVIGAWAYSVVTHDEAMTTAIMAGWPFILSIEGVFTSVLLSYFGVLRREHHKRLDAAQGVQKSPNIISKLINLLGK